MNPSRPINLFDYAFRLLALLGVFEIGALLINLVTNPAGVGLIGQGLLIRLLAGLLVVPGMLLAGTLVVWRAPGNVVGRFIILLTLGGAAAQFAFDPAASRLLGWVLVLIILYEAGVAAPAFGLLMLTFPTGQVYPPRLTRVAALLAVIKFIGSALEVMASPRKIKIFPAIPNPLFVPALLPFQPIIAATIGLTGALLPFIWVTGIVSLVFRYRAAPARDRRQIKWVVLAMGFLFPVMLFMVIGILSGYAVAGWAIPLATTFGANALLLFVAAIGLSIFRYRLFDIELILNRALVYGALTACVIGVYALIVGLAGELFYHSTSLVLSLLATGLIAVLFQPLRERLQRLVNRLMYGARDDPYAVLSRLSRQLESTLAPDSVLPNIVETLARTLKLPYAAIMLRNDGLDKVVAAFGLPTDKTIAFPLHFQQDRIGQLVVAPRSPDEVFTSAERRLLEDIARQTEVVVHSVQLTADLQRSRERLVTAREEERRRIRRDLHDGLGPTLAALNFRLGSLQTLVAPLPVAEALAGEIRLQLRAAIADIRRLVYDLRPPALDELGLVQAIREQAAQQSANGLRIVVEAPDELPALPAAVEVAAYRIILEAITNVARHAQASRCLVQIDGGVDFQIEITDNGQGLPSQSRAGVGLTAMRERAAELGGSCVIEGNPAGGTRVLARLPLTAPET